MSIFSRLACAWAVRSFGRDHVINARTRALRIVEEAIELCQAVGVPSEKVHLCAATVYKRPPGDPYRRRRTVRCSLLTTSVISYNRGMHHEYDVRRIRHRYVASPT